MNSTIQGQENVAKNEFAEKPTCLDFFAGSGLVSEALRPYFTPVWANDICEKKSRVYCSNHRTELFNLSSIEDINGAELPSAALSWASFPCQDLSLAGNLKGIFSSRSGLVWQWLRVMDEMTTRPPLLVAENVVGLVSAKDGDHYRKLHRALVKRGYRVGAIILDAARWVPQSRKRVFIIAVDQSIEIEEFRADGPSWCHPSAIQKVANNSSDWIWWDLLEPGANRQSLEDLIDPSAPCDNIFKTKRNLRLIPPAHMKKIEEAVKKGSWAFPGYKRIRNGRQVLELRFDGIAGCLRTPEGGSSRQVIVIAEGGELKTRLLTIPEVAALMGVSKMYKIPGTYNEGYKALGDAVAVPVARYLAEHLLSPIIARRAFITRAS